MYRGDIGLPYTFAGYTTYWIYIYILDIGPAEDLHLNNLLLNCSMVVLSGQP